MVRAGLLAVALIASVPTAAHETPGEERKVRFEPYGKVKLDASWDESLVNAGDYARWVESPGRFRDHDHVNLTARETRLGVRLIGGGKEGLAVSGKVELDFYGGGAANKNRPQLRHAMVLLDWKGSGWSFLAGQTGDVVSPLYPSTVNYTVAWWVGNIGYRRPQLRATHGWSRDGGRRLALELALARTVGDDFAEAEPGDSGADSGLPTLQSRVAYTWPGAGGHEATLGVSGHWGRENVHDGEAEPHTDLDSWSAGIDLALPLTGDTTLRAEVWTGTNLDDFLGGAGQGIEVDSGETIDASGGWLSVETVADPWRFGVGAGVDDPDQAFLTDEGRARNLALWANAFYDLTSAIRFGGEISYWETEYRGLETGTALRVQGTVIYAF
jgi:hypothetical protein